MMFRQLFDQLSGTYSYLLASRPGGEALIIDLQRWEKTQRLGRCAISAHPFRCALPAQGCAQ
jgi:hypothetical protein